MGLGLLTGLECKLFHKKKINYNNYLQAIKSLCKLNIARQESLMSKRYISKLP